MQDGGKGDKGLLVSILQAGLLVHGIRDTRIDAVFGDDTEEGVREFQREAESEWMALPVLRRLRDCSDEHETTGFCLRASFFVQ